MDVFSPYPAGSKIDKFSSDENIPLIVHHISCTQVLLTSTQLVSSSTYLYPVGRVPTCTVSIHRLHTVSLHNNIAQEVDTIAPSYVYKLLTSHALDFIEVCAAFFSPCRVPAWF